MSMGGLDDIIHRRPPTDWELFKSNPSLFLASKLYRWHSNYATSPSDKTVLVPHFSKTTASQTPIRTVCISDTHNVMISDMIPNGDILIHAGDLTHSGTAAELQVAFDWISALPHNFKIVVAGNHDTYLQTDEGRSWACSWKDRGIIYLEDSTYTIHVRGQAVKIFGSPYTPQHGNWAFQYPRRNPATDVPGGRWSIIPEDTDILVTHGPPWAHLDLTGLGCRDLLARMWEISRKRPPALHVFGHIHGGRGTEMLLWGSAQSAWENVVDRRGTWFGVLRLLCTILFAIQNRQATTIAVNAAVMGGPRDRDIRAPIVVDI